ncbi:hypothetical protein VULLAG_LOCUS7984 [Vulpes lagopus]
MITVSQTPDVGPKPGHLFQNSLSGQCLPDPTQPTLSLFSSPPSSHWEFPYCFHLSAHSNPKLSPAYVPFLPCFGPTPLRSPQILPLSSNLFPGCTSIFLNRTCPSSRAPQLSSSAAQCPHPSAWPSGVWSQPTFVVTLLSREPCLHQDLILPRSPTDVFIPNTQHLLNLLQSLELLLF